MRTDVFGNQTLFTLPDGFETLNTITANPDGNMYFFVTGPNDRYVGQITPQGATTFFPIPNNSLYFVTMITASDGNIWSVATDFAGSDSMIRMTTAGVFTTMNASFPYQYTLGGGPVRGADKNLWSVYSHSFVRTSVTDGSVTFFPTSSSGFFASIAAGSDGGVWASPFPRHELQRGLFRIDMAGRVTTFLPSLIPGTLVAGPNHDLFWGNSYKIHAFDEVTGKLIATITPPDRVEEPAFLAGPDSQLWMPVGNSVLVYVLHPIIATPSSITLTAGSSSPLSIDEPKTFQKTFTAVSNNPNVATVSGSGKRFVVIGVTAGSTTITVSDKIGNSLDVPVTVQ